jgi:chemotaxis protein CheC
MTNPAIPDFNEMEKQILQEIMNIAFGSASGDLEDVIDVSIMLHVPEIEMLPVHKLSQYLKENISLSETSTVIEEKFWGDFSGSSILVFPEGMSKGLITILSGQNPDDSEDPGFEVLEKGVLLEIGNILIGACIGKITELLKTVVTYTPPQASTGEQEDFDHILEDYNSDSAAIILKTFFRFKEHKLQGNLMVITSHQSILWLKNALNSFLEAYR